MMILIGKMMSEGKMGSRKITYPEFVNSVEKGLVSEVTFMGKQDITGRFKGGPTDSGERFHLTGDTSEQTFKILRSHGLIPRYEKEQNQTLFVRILINYGPMILLAAIFYFFFRQIQIGGGKAMSFGKSKAKMFSANDKKVTFADVSGVEEAKEELKEIVDFLKNSEKYTKLGGKIPKGVILIGGPGTGKTLLARAVAGEADVPFFSISGSDFVEMFVGVGASRVRDLFEQGKKHAPCIVFIDEIDAVGRHRGAGLGGGHDEREQTLNQLLVEMDGFESNEGVILIAATNRIDVLDPALLRPGRFDRRVTVPSPDVRGRLGILKVHTRLLKSNVAKNVSLEILARGTSGFTGADLANMVNEAALNAARLNKKKVDMRDFEAAKDKVLMGPERKSMAISDKEKRNTAYHEGGHALVGLKLPQTDPIHKVTIMPRGGALGITMTLPDEDRLSLNTTFAHNQIAVLMGGRCAEELIFGDYTSGAANDIERATRLAHNMVCKWGMSKKLGPLNYYKSNQTVAYSGQEINDYSETVAEEIDKEVRHFVDKNYQVAMKILKDNRKALERLAEALIVWETLDRGQVEAVVKGEDIGVPTIEEEVNQDSDSNDNESTSTVSSEPNPSSDKKKGPVPV